MFPQFGAAAVLVLPAFFVLVLGFRAVLGWTYNGTGSVFVVGLLHAASNAATGGSQLLGGPSLLPRLYEDDQLVSTMHLLAAAIVGLVIILATKGRLGLRERAHRLPGASA